MIFVTVKSSIALPNSISSYAPVTITNNQSTATPTNFQQELVINTRNYSTVYNSQNVEFTYSNLTVIPSWLEGPGNLPNQAVYWLKITKPIPGDSNITVFMDFANRSTNLLNNFNTGEAPQLECPWNPNTINCDYGEYDDGASVFSSYTNFAGNSLGLGWSEYTGGVNTSVTIDNGVTFTRRFASFTTYYAFDGYAALLNSNPVNSSEYFEVATPYYIGGDFGVWGGCSNVGAGIPYYIGEMRSSNIDSYGLVYGRAYVSYYPPYAPCGTAAPVYIYYPVENASFALGAPTSSIAYTNANQTPNGDRSGIDWYTSTSSYIYNPYYCGETYCVYNALSTGVGSAPAETYPAFGIENDTLIPPGNGPETVATFWARVRKAPPNGVMPYATFYPLQRFLNLTQGTYTIDAGKIVVTKVSAINNSDNVVLLLNGNAVFTGVYTGNALIYNISNSLAPGVYNLKLIDNTSNAVLNGSLEVFPDPSVHVAQSDPTIDQYQYTTLQAITVNGTGAFSYQWYNDTGGAGNPIANAVSPTLIVNGSMIGNFYYSVIVNDTAGNYIVNSSNVLVTVEPALNITLTKSINGNTMKINASVSGGTGNFAYQWYNATNLLLQLPIANAVSNSFAVRIPNSTVYNYTLLVTDLGTTTQPKWAIESAMANTPAPVVHLVASVVPNTPTIDNGSRLTLTVLPSGGPAPYTYQWLSGNSPVCSSDQMVAGATSNTYNAAPSSNTYYCCLLTDSQPANVYSNADLVTVNQKLAPRLSLPASVTAGQNIVGTATWAGGTPSYNVTVYMWNFSSPTCPPSANYGSKQLGIFANPGSNSFTLGTTKGVGQYTQYLCMGARDSAYGAVPAYSSINGVLVVPSTTTTTSTSTTSTTTVRTTTSTTTTTTTITTTTTLPECACNACEPAGACNGLCPASCPMAKSCPAVHGVGIECEA